MTIIAPLRSSLLGALEPAERDALVAHFARVNTSVVKPCSTTVTAVIACTSFSPVVST